MRFCRRNDLASPLKNIFLLLAIFLLLSVCSSRARPQRSRNNNNNNNRADAPGGRLRFPLSPAVRPTVLFIRPLFDREGRLIEDEEPGSRRQQPNSNNVRFEDVTTRAPRPVSRRPPPATRPPTRPPRPTTTTAAPTTTTEKRITSLRGRPDPVDFEESLPPVPQSLNDIPLPIFGRPETILKATQQLKQLDRNQEQFIKTSGANAGVLPLAFETSGSLNLFPPLRAAKRLPKHIKEEDEIAANNLL